MVTFGCYSFSSLSHGENRRLCSLNWYRIPPSVNPTPSEEGSHKPWNGRLPFILCRILLKRPLVPLFPSFSQTGKFLALYLFLNTFCFFRDGDQEILPIFPERNDVEMRIHEASLLLQALLARAFYSSIYDFNQLRSLVDLLLLNKLNFLGRTSLTKKNTSLSHVYFIFLPLSRLSGASSGECNELLNIYGLTWGWTLLWPYA